MINNDGLFFRVIVYLIFSLGFVLFFLATKKFYKESDSKFVLGTYIACFIFSVSMAVMLTINSFSPNVESFRGTYVDSNNVSSFFPFSNSFSFKSEETTETFVLDSFTIKKHYTNSFEEGKTYSVYYKKCFLNGKIIVGIEETD